MPTSLQTSMATIEQFINTVGQVKTASEKTADGSKPMSEPGSIGGETKHPVKNVDDRLQDPPEGERFKENTKDVNEDQGKTSIQNAAEAKAGADRAASVFNLVARFAHPGQQKRAEGGAVMQGGSAEDDQNQTGTKKTPTGEDPSVETESAKAGKDDKKQGNMGGTSHPASTENDKIDGHKWASDPLEKLAGDMKKVGDDLCAQIAWISQQQGAPATAVKAAAQAGTGTGQSQERAGTKTASQIDPWLAQQVGWEMAGLIGGSFDKKAADSMVIGTLEQIIKTGADYADRYIHFMDHYLAGQQKQADGSLPPPPGAGADPTAGGGGPPPPPPGGGEGGAAPGGDEAAMMAALGGGADAGGGGGAPPGGEGGAAPGMGGGDPEVMQLAKILEQMGVTPEELEQAMQEQAGGGAGPDAGGPPPGAGAGGPPPGGGGGGGGMEPQAADRHGNHKQAGQDKMAGMRQYISEIVQRSRARR